MALNSSGPISLGGATQGESVNLELGAGASSLISFNDADVRTLTGTTANTALTMPTEFYGKALGISVQYLLVGGGGGGQSSVFTTLGAGGGGGGGVASGFVTIPTSGPITVTVGTGGSADASGANTSISGSTISTVTAVGGGYGGGGNGGSGGGAGGGVTASGGTGTVGQGNAGGASTATGSGGGGGGASAAGADGSATGGGSGGAGTLSTISGAATYYGGGGGAGGGTLFYTISKSLRLRATSGAYLSRIPTTAGNRKTWTWSAWIKRGVLSTSDCAILGAQTDANNRFYCRFESDDKLYVYFNVGGTAYDSSTSMVFRDTASWYHLVIAVDTTQSTSTNRLKIYVNGTQQTLGTYSVPPQNTDTQWNNTVVQYIGKKDTASSFFDGYIAEVNGIDGQALTPTSFGATNPTTGVWGPSQYTGSYGTNGYYLPFTDTASVYALGYDLKTGTSHIGSSGTYTVPSYSSSLVVELWGGGGGGGGGGATYGNNGGSGGATTFAAPGGTLSAGGGTGGTGVYRTDQGSPSGTGVSGSGGTASGGDTNTNGNSIATSNASSTGAGAPNGGGNTATAQNNADSFNGTYPGGAASGGVYLGPSQPTGGAGGSGAYVKKTYTAGQLTVGSSITAVVGTGGAGGSADAQPGGAGAGGVIRIGIDGVTVNDWAPVNVSLTSGANYDSMTDVPTLTSATASNYAVLNPLENVNTTYMYFQNGDLRANMGTGAATMCWATMVMPTDKWYWEVTITQVSNGTAVGISYGSNTVSDGNSKGITYAFSGGKRVLTVDSSYGASYTTGDVIGVAVDKAANTITFYKNNVSQGAITDSTISTQNYRPMIHNNTSSGGGLYDINFGQRPFVYTPPTGYVRLNAYNLSTPTIPAGNKYMDATLFTGSISGATVTNAGGFKPDFVWNKTRDVVQNHFLIDSVRGGNKLLYSDLTNAESTNSQLITSFNSTGYTYGNALASNNSYVSWMWQAGQGTTSTNTNGSITSTTSVSVTSGFSIVTWTANGSSNQSIGHGLGVAPSMIFVKDRTTVNNWNIWFTGFSANEYLQLNTTAAKGSYSTLWYQVPTSNVFYVGTSGTAANYQNGDAYVAYCWSAVPGYSAFGSYTGNGVTPGPFIYCGFQPRWILIRSTSDARSWCIWDTARNTYNLSTNGTLFAESSSAEYSGGGAYTIGITSNGFYLPVSTTNLNGTGETMLYAAFATNPFKYSLAF